MRPNDATEIGLAGKRDTDDSSVEPQALTIEECKCGKPQQQRIKFSARKRERCAEDRNCGECGAEKQERFIAMKGAEHIAGGELSIEHEH